MEPNPDDTTDRIRQLILQGHSPGEAQELALGRQPLTVGQQQKQSPAQAKQKSKKR
jgi:hypothetical protein